ncbi:MAG: hypothetical protein CMB64_07475 [Euryarchaeota archaeon]|nr:hypothetical protein [Euryarchaeota archaeon]|tara:strand:+ start:179 stop:646 length:468 start_codon:yes stop_codon:yes gene_type:complete
MPIHALMCSTIASGLQDINLITKSLEWLCNKKEIVEIEKTTSYHGSPITLMKIKLSRSQSRMTLSRLGGEILNKLIEESEDRLDDENRLHFRLNQNELVKGKISMGNINENSIKIIAKIEVYPGEQPLMILQKLLTESLERCERRGWLNKPPDFL